MTQKRSKSTVLLSIPDSSSESVGAMCQRGNAPCPARAARPPLWGQARHRQNHVECTCSPRCSGQGYRMVAVWGGTVTAGTGAATAGTGAGISASTETGARCGVRQTAPSHCATLLTPAIRAPPGPFDACAAVAWYTCCTPFLLTTHHCQTMFLSAWLAATNSASPTAVAFNRITSCSSSRMSGTTSSLA